jgi:hypothetical protein
MPVRHEFGAIFEDADFFDLRKDPEPFEHGNGLREQRFPNVEAGMRILFEHVHIPALIRKKSGNRRAGRASSDDEDIASDTRLLGCTVLVHY